MPLNSQLVPYTLDFKFPAGTSRGVLHEKQTYFLKIWDETNPTVIGWGECGPLKKLSVDDLDDLFETSTSIIKDLDGEQAPKNRAEVYSLAFDLAGYQYPALRFSIETALLDLINGGVKKVFDNDFFSRKAKIPINGLIWMGHMEGMLLQISDKVVEGFDCIKMKVGSLDFEKEVDILNYVRSKYYDQEILLRVDANGAFKPEEAMYKMQTMARSNIHSVEQPIAAGQIETMAELCQNTPIDIALDEELIGVNGKADKEALLKVIKPQYIIIKPTLLGGLASSQEWIEIAEVMKIGWWITSALESNVGLNAICQFAYEMNAKSYQGLGTGKLYHNNIQSPLTISNGFIHYDSSKEWDTTFQD